LTAHDCCSLFANAEATTANDGVTLLRFVKSFKFNVLSRKDKGKVYPVTCQEGKDGE